MKIAARAPQDTGKTRGGGCRATDDSEGFPKSVGWEEGGWVDGLAAPGRLHANLDQGNGDAVVCVCTRLI